MKKKQSTPFILWFNEISIKDIPLVGGKNASLGEMFQNLKKQKIKIPEGFAITSAAYKYVLEKSGAIKDLKAIMNDLDINNSKSLQAAGKQARQIILNSEIPSDLQDEIIQAYHKLSDIYHPKKIDIAVHSSATAEDLPQASFEMNLDYWI